MNTRILTCSLLLAATPLAALAQTTFTKITEGAIVTDGGSSYGCAWGDYDNDGLIDLAVANAWGQDNFLYRNTGNGAFTRILTGPFVTDGLDSIKVILGDYDNDGFLDLFSTTFDPPSTDALYHNNGDGTFTQITSGPQSNDSSAGTWAAWVDYDRDGWLDLFVANSQDQNEFLYHNNANGTFTRITSGPLVNSGRVSTGSAWGDYDNDGDPDVFVANSGPASQNDFLFRNDGSGVFTRITSGPVVTDAAQSVGSAWGDYDNDGDLDLVVATHFHQNDRLYQNQGDGTFSLVEDSVVANDGLTGTCLAWGDFDNDGWLDLFVGNAQGDPNRLYRNRGDGSFDLDADSPLSTEGGASLGCAWGDYDKDGFLDLFVANGGTDPNVFGESDNYLYRNNGNTNRWLLVKLIGSIWNRSAIGAKVRVKARIGGKIIEQLREVSGNGQNDLRAHFGLGDAAKAETVRIEWPSGIVQEFRDVAVKQILPIVEPPVLAAISPGRVLVRGAKDINYAIEVSNDLRAWARSGVVKGGADFVDTEAN